MKLQETSLGEPQVALPAAQLLVWPDVPSLQSGHPMQHVPVDEAFRRLLAIPSPAAPKVKAS